MDVQLHRWENRLGTLAVVGHLTPIQHYMRLYHQITRRLIGNPALRPPRDVGYSALAGQCEALVSLSYLDLSNFINCYVLKIIFFLFLLNTNAPGGRTAFTHLGVREYALPWACGACRGDVRISENGIRQAGEIRRMAEPVPEAEYQATPGAPRGGGRAGKGRHATGGRRARRGRGAAAKGPGGGGHHLVDEADEADPIPEGVHGLVHPQPFQAGGSSPGDSPTFTPALLLAEIPGSSSQPSQNAYMEERYNVDWAAFRASLADERPVRNLKGARILDFNEFLIPIRRQRVHQSHPLRHFLMGLPSQ
ncbi:uncharacterized protein LOC132638589 [Lycium barbarum]|uniref:uncharacterized protein LOC132638589 n=1 Tax=Lycium barbarum TaxID=112863 RepID=UPI00293E34D0|nr:uncharacterized protein LOC132638589 [Lycium barbarum]